MADYVSRLWEKARKIAPLLTRDQLKQSAETQQLLAAQTGYTPDVWLLEQEAKLIKDRRQLLGRWEPKPEPEGGIFAWARANKLTGLCFSGGGIRSATFNLGVLQGMAEKGLLEQFDYLSTVSGGGYIHSWLAGWLKRNAAGRPLAPPVEAAYDAWKYVMGWLRPLSTEPPPNQPPVEHPHRMWAYQIRWLRRYSNYLTPRKGLLTGDTWSAFATWLRNVLLNQALLLFMFLALLSLPHLLAPSTRLLPYTSPAQVSKTSVSSVTTNQGKTTTVSLEMTMKQEPATVTARVTSYAEAFQCYFSPARWPRGLCATWLAVAAGLVYLLGCFCIGLLLQKEYREATHLGGERNWEFPLVCFGVVAPLLVFGVLLTEIVRLHTPNILWTLKVFCLLLGLVWTETFFGGALQNAAARKRNQRKAETGEKKGPGVRWLSGTVVGLLLLGVPAAAAGSLLAVLIAALLRSARMECWRQWLLLSDSCSLVTTLGGLLFFWLPPLTMVIAAGLIGKNFPDWVGEWLARVRAYTLVTGLGWIALCGGALLLPGAAVHAFSAHWVGWTGGGAWIVATFSGVLSGKSGKTTGDQQTTSLAREVAAVIGPYVYIAGLALMLSAGLEWFRNAVWHWPGPHLEWLPGVVALRRLTYVRQLAWVRDELRWVTVFVCLNGLAALLGWRLDVNQFSMHSFYRNRLTRCYLGASNLTRKPSPVTGFDERDSNDLFVHELRAPHYPGPIPIFCCAMNITTGEDLAWQERKAASFAITPAYSGYALNRTQWSSDLSFNGFVPTEMLYPGGPTVASAMAASGAAVSPNWGYHTQPATAFLLTMFDARLGLWIPNPRWSPFAGNEQSTGKILPSSPKFAPYWLVNELLGSVSDTSKYVYVTDGGHFDNTGLYELVRRRCYQIVICDAEEDGKYDYEGIGTAIRKCRIDFGVEIDLDLASLSPNTQSQLSPAHVVRGSIRYPETPQGKSFRGTVIYIKASLTATPPAPPLFWFTPPTSTAGAVQLPNVPGDVQNYKLQHADFPHDSTAEQWFTESQFESYRRLGQSIVSGIAKFF